MKLIIVFLCALSVYGCGDSVAKSRYYYYYPQDPQIHRYFASISDRLDKLESLRGTADQPVFLSQIQRTEESAKNSNAVTLTNGDFVTLVSVDLGNVVEGDRIHVYARAAIVKGATGGRTLVFIGKITGSGGTATIKGGDDENSVFGQDIDQGANDTNTFPVSGVIKVTGSGTLQLVFRGFSSGSDSTVGANSAQIYALVIRGTS